MLASLCKGEYCLGDRRPSIGAGVTKDATMVIGIKTRLVNNERYCTFYMTVHLHLEQIYDGAISKLSMVCASVRSIYHFAKKAYRWNGHGQE